MSKKSSVKDGSDKVVGFFAFYPQALCDDVVSGLELLDSELGTQAGQLGHESASGFAAVCDDGYCHENPLYG